MSATTNENDTADLTIFRPVRRCLDSQNHNEYRQCIEKSDEKPEWTMISWDHRYYDHKVGEWRASKRFAVLDTNHLISWYGDLQKRHIYEIIREGRPVRLYLDLDYNYGENNDSLTSDELAKRVELLLDRLAQICKDWWGITPVAASHQDASTQDKFSRHIIFENIILRRAEECKHIVQALIASEPSLSAFTDTAVYTKNRAFRFLYSSKIGKDNTLVPLGGDARFDREAFEKSFVSYFPVTPTPLDVPEHARYLSKVIRKRLFPRATEEESAPKRQRATRTLKLTEDELVSLRDVTGVPDLHTKFHCTVEGHEKIRLAPQGDQLCFVNEGTTHRSNCTMIELDAGGGAKVFCFGCHNDNLRDDGPHRETRRFLHAQRDSKLTSATAEGLLSLVFQNWETLSTHQPTADKSVAELVTSCCIFCPHDTPQEHMLRVELYKGRHLTMHCRTCHKRHRIDLQEKVVALNNLFDSVDSEDIVSDANTVTLDEGHYFSHVLTTTIIARVRASLDDGGNPYTLLNKSNMNVGKTVSLVDVLRAVLKERPGTRILVECSRRSLGGELFSHLKALGFELYSHCQGSTLAEKQRLICQVESTRKLLTEHGEAAKYDIVVVDEWTAHLAQFLSDTVRSGDIVTSMACERWRDAKSMLCLCADAGSEQLQVLQLLRGDEVSTIKVVKPSAAIHLDYVAMSEAKSRALECLFSLEAARNLFIPSNSLSECQALIDTIKARARSKVEWKRHVDYARNNHEQDPEGWACQRLTSILNGILFLRGNDGDEWYKERVFHDKKVKSHVPKQLWLRASDGAWTWKEQDRTGKESTTRLCIFTPTLLHGSSFDKACTGGHFAAGVAMFSSHSTCGRECVQALGRLREMNTYTVGITQAPARPETRPLSQEDREHLYRARKRNQRQVHLVDSHVDIDESTRQVFDIVRTFAKTEREASADTVRGKGLIYEMERVRRNNPGNTATFDTSLNPRAAGLNATEAALAKINLMESETDKMVDVGALNLDEGQMQQATREELLAHRHYKLCMRIGATKPLSARQLGFLQVFESRIHRLANVFQPIDYWDEVKESCDPSKIEFHMRPVRIKDSKSVDDKTRAKILGILLHKTGFMPHDPDYSPGNGMLSNDKVTPEERLSAVQGLVNLINLSYNAPERKDTHGKVSKDRRAAEERTRLNKKYKFKIKLSGDIDLRDEFKECWTAITGNTTVTCPVDAATAPDVCYREWARLLVCYFDQNGMRDLKGNTAVKRSVKLGAGVTAKHVAFPNQFNAETMGPVLDAIRRGIRTGPLRQRFDILLEGINAWDQSKCNLSMDGLVDAFALQRSKVEKRTNVKGRAIAGEHKAAKQTLLPCPPEQSKPDALKTRMAHIRRCLARNPHYPLANMNE